jgi:leucine-rich repeat protein SHOC2
MLPKMNPVYDYIQRNRVLAKIEKAHGSKATNLALDDHDLLKFPPSLISCEQLCYLNIGHNRIAELPKSLGCLKNLHNLCLEYNNFDRFPEVLKDLPQLTSLNISHNPIKDLTRIIGCLTSLETLWCNRCCLTSLPEEIGNLVKLDTLGARHNQITKLPDGICNLVHLR